MAKSYNKNLVHVRLTDAELAEVDAIQARMTSALRGALEGATGVDPATVKMPTKSDALRSMLTTRGTQTPPLARLDMGRLKVEIAAALATCGEDWGGPARAFVVLGLGAAYDAARGEYKGAGNG